MRVVLKVVEKLKHVGDLATTDPLHDFYLWVGLLQVAKGLLNFDFVDDFDRDFAPRVSMLAQRDFRKRAECKYPGM